MRTIGLVIPGSSTASYRALLALPSMAPIVVSLFLSRTAQAMSGIALTLFTLAEFGSATLAGIVAFASFAPSILVSPIAGALLDRHGRVRLIGLDFVVAMVAISAIGLLSLVGLLTAELLVAIAVVTSLTSPLSMTGLRTLFPILVPPRLWERANALDSTAFVTAAMIGPVVAAGAIAFLGPAPAMVGLGIPYGLAVLALRGVRSPRSDPDAAGPILREAWAGLRYVWQNRTLRGLAISMSARTFAGGIVVIVIPVIVLRQIGGSELGVGIALACSGVAGLLSAMVMGRVDSRGRERHLMMLPLLATGPVLALLLLPVGWLGAPQPLVGFAIVCLAMTLLGLLDGPLDIGLFTMRQRRTPTAWIGRAFAISMSVNAVGYPVGSAVAGFMSETSLSLAVVLAAVSAPLSAVLVSRLVPRSDPAADAESVSATSGVMAPAAGASEGSPARPAH
jgi:MFS family permease